VSRLAPRWWAIHALTAISLSGLILAVRYRRSIPALSDLQFVR
jgi:hypothetical protein